LGFIEKLEPKNDVMADRGFNLRDLGTKRNATLNISPFAKGKQLSAKACTEIRRIAYLIVHVQRAIQRMKKVQKPGFLGSPVKLYDAWQYNPRQIPFCCLVVFFFPNRCDTL